MSSRIALCIPSGEMVHADFMLSLHYLAQKARAAGHRVSLVNSRSSLIAQGRNLAIRAALESDVEWLLFLDSDMTFPADTVLRLLAHARPIVGATYPRKGWPLAYIGYRHDFTPFAPGETGLVEAARLPAGCLLLQASVFATLAPPYFRCSYDEAAGEILSEDFWFSDRLRSLGHTLWCDLDLSRQLEHLGTFHFRMGAPPSAG